VQTHGALEKAEEAASSRALRVNFRSLLEASGFRGARLEAADRLARKIALFRDCAKLFMLEARDNPGDRAYLLACAKDLYRRYQRARGS